MKSKFTKWPRFHSYIFLLLGLMNTVFIKEQDVGTYKNYLGYAFLVFVFLEMLIHFINKYKNHGEKK